MGANGSILGHDAGSYHSEDTLSMTTSTVTATEVPASTVRQFFSKDNKFSKFKQKIKRKFDLKKSTDHGQVIRDFLNLLNLPDLIAVFEEYKSTLFLKELFQYAESARPIASNLRNDLSELYDFKYNSDVTLVYKGVHFAVHRAIVAARCPYFRELVLKKPVGSVVPVNLDIKGLRVELFNDLLKFLYTGELAGSYDASSNTASYKALIRISQECGVPNPLLHDLKNLLDTGLYSDASLCFQTEISNHQNNNELGSSGNINQIQNDKVSAETSNCTCCKQAEYACHQAILAARSPFFRNVITRQHQRKASLKRDHSTEERMKIVLDESIIPRRFARILLHVMYRDADDLMNLIESSICKCNHTNATGGEAMKNSQSTRDPHQSANLSKEIMSLYEIARFLEIDFFVQSCEDLIIELLSLDTLIPILTWSGQPHGSPWVRRQALCYLKEEFATISSYNDNKLLYQLDYSHLVDILKSDFTEASELSIMEAIIKWGEYHYKQNIRSPFAVEFQCTLPKISKKEVDYAQLREMIGELLDMVRVEHILPMGAKELNEAIKKGLIIKLPPPMSSAGPLLMAQNLNVNAWFRTRNSADTFQRPRYFPPYFEETLRTLEQRLGYPLSIDDDCSSSTATLTDIDIKKPLHMPDTLYMVNKSKLNMIGSASMVSDGDLVLPIGDFHFCFTSSSASSVPCYDHVDTKSNLNLPIIERHIHVLMKQRERELKTAPLCLRALKISHDRCKALSLIQLRVVREFGLPDIAAETLHTKKATPGEDGDDDDDFEDNNVPPEVLSRNNMNSSEAEIPPPRPPVPGFMLPTTSVVCDPFSYDSELKLESSSRYELESQVCPLLSIDSLTLFD